MVVLVSRKNMAEVAIFEVTYDPSRFAGLEARAAFAAPPGVNVCWLHNLFFAGGSGFTQTEKYVQPKDLPGAFEYFRAG